MNDVSVATLTRHPFLQGLSDEHLRLLAGVAERVHIPAKERLFEEGDVADRFWLIDGGPISLDLFVPGKGHMVVETLGMGDVLGWSWLFPPYRWRFGVPSPAARSTPSSSTGARCGTCAPTTRCWALS